MVPAACFQCRVGASARLPITAEPFGRRDAREECRGPSASAAHGRAGRLRGGSRHDLGGTVMAMSSDEDCDCLAAQLRGLPVREFVDVLRRMLPGCAGESFGMRT